MIDRKMCFLVTIIAFYVLYSSQYGVYRQCLGTQFFIACEEASTLILQTLFLTQTHAHRNPLFLATKIIIAFCFCLFSADKTVSMEVGKLIQKCRTEKELTQKDLATVSESAVIGIFYRL